MAGLRFLSLNCHGLSDDVVSYLHSIISEFDFVLLQETWLSNFNSHTLNNISDDFIHFHNSAMETKLRSGFLTGRPFGGTAILVRRCFADKVSVVPSDNPRITAVCCAFSGQPDLFIGSVYMPWNDRSIHQLDEYESSMGDLQALLDSHRGCMFVIGGDWNVDKDGCYAARTCVQRFCSVNNLCWLEPTHNSVKFSFHNDVNGHFSLVDHFVLFILCG